MVGSIIRIRAYLISVFIFLLILIVLVYSDGILAETIIANDLKRDSTFEEEINLSLVWSGHPIGLDLSKSELLTSQDQNAGFEFLTYKDQQFVAFYNKDRKMTVMSRMLGSKKWRKIELSTSVGWDSHNYIIMAIDDNEDIHLAGNMHVSPLIYFRTARPLDITSFQKINSMVGKEEDRVTYPQFLRGPKNEFIFSYRYGESGSGVNYYNVYNHTTQTWKRLMDKPLFGYEGADEMSAYPYGPIKDKNGLFHIVWVWRDRFGAEFNHDVSYARSKDLVNWETSSGEHLELPITIKNGEIVDPVPVKGGVINNNVKIGFDGQNRPIVSYHKYDSNGNTQIYNARLENGAWKIYQTSDWNDRWEFGGGGSIEFKIGIAPVEVEANGGLSQKYSHWIEGSGIWRLDEKTLKPIGTYPPPDRVPPDLKKVESSYQCVEDGKNEGMQVHIMYEKGTTEKDANYFMRWETLPPNRDLPRNCESPIPPTILRLYKFADETKLLKKCSDSEIAAKQCKIKIVKKKKI